MKRNPENPNTRMQVPERNDQDIIGFKNLDMLPFFVEEKGNMA